MKQQVDIEAAVERIMQRYPKILGRLDFHERVEAASERLHETFDPVLHERIPDDIRRLVERL